MEGALKFLVEHGYVLLFGVVLIAQLGVPSPSEPMLLAAGALARSEQLTLGVCLGIAVAASLLGQTVWYEAGRRSGGGVLRVVCRLSLEPDLCVRKTQDLFARRGSKTLVIAYFIPGFGLVAPPLAGTLRMHRARFLSLSLTGAVLWTSTFIGLGFLFSKQLEEVAAIALRLGSGVLVLLLALTLGWFAWKLYQRRSLISELRTARITPEELKRRLDAGETILVVDLRHALEFDAEPTTIPGALHLAPDELDARLAEIPRDREIALFCTCPNEATSARVAMLLKKRGITRVRPLMGGYRAWRDLNYPLEAPADRAAADAPSTSGAP